MAPELALARGRWVKLICGASNHDLAAIEDLCALYSLVGVDCIDVAADPAAVMWRVTSHSRYVPWFERIHVTSADLNRV
jgi:hypothetical protein